MPVDRAIKELSFDVSFRTVHMAKSEVTASESKVVVEWPF